MSAVPDLGPRPEPFEFPFAEASSALQATNELIDDLRSMVSTHTAAAGAARVGFAGAAREQFDTGLEASLEAVEDQVVTLNRDAGALEAMIREARHRRTMSAEAIATYDAALRAHQASLASPMSGPS